MAEVRSTQLLTLGSPLPAFILPDGERKPYGFAERVHGPVVVMFVCNHCPYVIHLADAIGAMAAEFAGRVSFFAINSNDVERYPADAPALMVEFARRHGWNFPYLYDEDQSVARAYGAACTPDFFVGEAEGKLIYRGQFDDSRPARTNRPGTGHPVDGSDLRAAIVASLNGAGPPERQPLSSGCNIKWKPGNEPAWFPVG